MWRETGDGHGVTLIVTAAGLDAIGVEAEGVNPARLGANEASSECPATETASEPEAAPNARTPREGTKQATLIAMLRAPDGATVEEMAAALA